MKDKRKTRAIKLHCGALANFLQKLVPRLQLEFINPRGASFFYSQKNSLVSVGNHKGLEGVFSSFVGGN